MTKSLIEMYKIDFVRAQGQTIEEMRDHVRNDPQGQELIRRGDTILVWVNEGDLYLQRMNVDLYNLNLALDTLDNPDEGI